MSTPDQQKLVLDYLKEHPCSTKAEIAAGVSLTVRETERIILELRGALSQVEECEDEGKYRTTKPPVAPTPSRPHAQ